MVITQRIVERNEKILDDTKFGTPYRGWKHVKLMNNFIVFLQGQVKLWKLPTSQPPMVIA